MKLCNIIINEEIHLAIETERGLVDATAAAYGKSMDELIRSGSLEGLAELASDSTLPVVEAPVYANIVNDIGKLVCVGLNYREHAIKTNMPIPSSPILFSKFDNALVPTNTDVLLPEWEESYDYEAELVIVIGRECWNVSEEEAAESIFGYSCGNDLSLRAAQMRSGQWLIGKTLPGFGPCGPCVVTADEYEPKGKAIRSYVNGELRQNSCLDEMIFNCAQVISYASKYIKLCPGDLIYTGTPSGVALEGGSSKFPWLKKGDVVDIEIEGIGRLTNKMI